ncbi:hypothetical protein [Oscillochloris sp. ZM17-4]|uniref:hypothetical protein n=1 Tax=Oscillochloris sp. ZM17-4 TaxID=2866714 RepID=UPI001C73D627|nr:hypothetical protein [Oscillochloris sp. ZM17-4]
MTIVISFQCGVLTRWIRASRTVEREYGDTSPWRVYIELALITICTSIMFLPSLALIEVLKINAASQYDSQQMTVDINTVDEVVSSRLNQLKTEYPQFVQDETTNLSDCEQVIEYTKALIAVDATFFDKLAMSGESLKAYDDRILNHIENIDQLKNYCSTLSLVHSTRDFAFSHSGLGEVFFYGMHIVIVFSGWFWVNARYYPLRVFASLSIIIIIGITIVSIAAIVAFGFPLLSDWILRRPFREVSVSHFLNVLAVTTTLATAVSLQVIFSINERQIYSREKAYLITALPLLLCAAVILVNVAFVRSIIIVGMSTLGLAIALFLLLPALKNQQNKLYSLPEE